MATFDTTIRSFLTQAASNSPTPGGGSVAALVAALGASMTSMVGNLTQGAKFADVEANMTAAVERMTAAIGQFEQLLEADMASFDRYMAALKLPKDTDEQKAARSQALQEASIHATEVPMRLARLCLDALQISATIGETANKNVISDLGIAALLLESAAQSALLTVDMNLPGLKDLERKSAYAAERDALLNSITPLKDQIVTTVRKRLA
ncbi:formiminotetrahydrofolate cyclodeaminase [Tumebacillus sp. BK434]|uniref:cyclodeaminase/cyclohydrolase family protein n=1 Tax=Tumebacillus sp. BK434 TaxID=2512169 RepID=UPI00104A4F3C|nr:cyclodeaminase/cyclohydrolase family protein [Tumebacillus sp. BK434]TCP55463.1 formiminotetrahydrofolate cyclodeaminase [Tumebacillus sp. BK434]